MEKTKLGIPVVLMSVIVCLLGYYGGYTVVALMVGYVLLAEESESLKRLAVKVLAILLAFSLANTAVSLLPNLLELFRAFVNIFDAYALSEAFYNNWLYRFTNFISTVLSLLKMLVFIWMACKTLDGKEAKIPVLDKFLDKYFCKQEV